MNQCRNGGSDLPPFLSLFYMNLEITQKEQYQLLDGLIARIKVVESLISTFRDIELISIYVKERSELIELQRKLQSL